MEEEKYTAYDVEEAPQAEAPQMEAPKPPKGGADVRDQSSDCRDAPSARSDAKNSENSENPENIDSADNADNDDNDENAGINPAEREIQRMVKEMGADKVLDIIRDNRNSAISQIISEIQAKSNSPFPSGVSAASPCSSIFDLAALA